MTENGITMYGTERCSHCQNQKALFGDAFANVSYVDCDADRQACLDAGVRGFPTWIDSENNPYPGTQTLERLAAISGCEDVQ
jgi:glutaredoxin